MSTVRLLYLRHLLLRSYATYRQQTTTLMRGHSQNMGTQKHRYHHWLAAATTAGPCADTASTATGTAAATGGAGAGCGSATAHMLVR